MPARFDKSIAGPDFDGFDAAAGYQMVPFGGRRLMGVATDNERATLQMKNPSVATILPNLIPGPGVAKFDVEQNTRLLFQILPLHVGRTELVLSTASGRTRQALTISVKAKWVEKVQPILLSDIRRATTRSLEDVQTILAVVRQSYLQQANVDLQVATPVSVSVPADLGSPIVPADTPTRVAIHRAVPPAFMSDPLLVRLFCCWDVDDANVRGATLGRDGFVEDGGTTTDFKTRATFAHEVGHALGLPHHDDNTGLMFPFSGTRLAARLFRAEIDSLNQSGTMEN
jgi:hypothetical protein